MSWKRRLSVAGLALALILPILAVSAVMAQDTEGSSEEAPAEEKKPGFFGDRFALYVEVLYGESSASDIEPDIRVSQTLITRNTYDLDSADHARFVVGWQLPEEKGSFLVTFAGHNETGFEFDAAGQRLDVADPRGNPRIASEPVTWWTVNMSDGQFTSSMVEATWTPSLDDANSDTMIDLDEIRFVPTSLGVTRSIPDTLQNQIQTVDLTFTRDWGGRVVDASWEAGFRYFVYEGNHPIASWLRPDFRSDETEGQGFTDGDAIHLLNFSQETSGIGPTGSVEVRVNLLRERIVLYGRARAAFIIQDMETDTGDFFTLARETTSGVLFPAAARLTEDRSKDVWHSGAEVGGRLRLAKGLVLHLSFFQHVYHDALLLPTRLAIPETIQESPQGTDALYKTRDFRMSGVRGGFSFQF